MQLLQSLATGESADGGRHRTLRRRLRSSLHGRARRAFCGYAKLCASRPVDVWSVQAVWKLTAPRGYIDGTEALQAVEALSLRAITELRAPVNDDFWEGLVAHAERQNDGTHGPTA